MKNTFSDVTRYYFVLSAVIPAFEYTKPPMWWKDEIPIRVQCAVGHPDDYEFRHPHSDDVQNFEYSNF